MKNKMMYVVMGGAILTAVNSTMAAVSTFDEEALDPETHWGGAGTAVTGFISGDAYFPHNADDWSWEGFVYSNMTDTTTPGYMNQFSAITGGGVEDSNNFGICAIPLDWMTGTYDPIPQSVSFEESTEVAGAYFTNITFPYLSMRDGDFFAKKFGGPDGTDPDYFRLIITGVDSYGNETGSVIFYLADFRASNDSEDYIVDQWTWVDLSPLGAVISLEFTMESSDMGAFGINTPTYFGIDNLTTVPKPIDVVVDIRPGSQINPVSTRSNGCLPITISGTESFDIESIDTDLLCLQGVACLRSFKVDVSAPTPESESTQPTTLGGDGYEDLVAVFDVQEIIAALGDVSDGQVWQLALTGTLNDGTPIQGSDEILIKGKHR
ncbi:MAG: DUF4465 domain-containing protein [Phycisphaerae bacterium]|nr:DUF4465 domain-containing protein [Phycisphaerae bacterium]